MRSELIHEAIRALPNRYLLCQVASKATRKFHRPNTRVQETMNEVLERFSDIGEPGRVATAPEPLAEPLRRAA